MRAHLLAVTAVAALLGCGSTPTFDRVEPLPLGGTPVEVRDLGRILDGTGSEVTPAAREVVRSAEEWAAAWQAISPANASPPSAPATDFSARMLVLVSTGVKPSGGYDVQVPNAATDEGGGLRIGVVTLEPAGCATTGAQTNAIRVVELPRHEGAIEFVEQTEPRRCL